MDKTQNIATNPLSFVTYKKEGRVTMKRIITLTISILLLFGSLSACGQNVTTTHSKYENIPEVNWYYEFFSDKDDTVAITNNQA